MPEPRFWVLPDGSTERNDGYQESDAEIVDYGLWRPEGVELSVRGPEIPRGDRARVVCLGAAQTFGRLVREPFPALLGARLGVPVANLGIAGARPQDYLDHPRLLDLVNESDVAVVQVMSARSVLHRALLEAGAEKMNEVAAWYLERIDAGATGELSEAVGESRRLWVDEMRRLLAAIEPPVILLWFSKREPDYRIDFRSLGGIFGGAPQLVDATMLDAIRPLADGLVSVVTDSGLPFPLVSRHDGSRVTLERADGKQRTETSYYPSPEMHREVAEALMDPVAELRPRI